MENRTIRTVVMIIAVAIVGTAFLVINSRVERGVEKTTQEAVEQKMKVKEFTQFFIARVLSTEEEVSFDDRLKLENDARALGDSQILDLWQKFVASTNDREAETNLWNLMTVLVSRM